MFIWRAYGVPSAAHGASGRPRPTWFALFAWGDVLFAPRAGEDTGPYGDHGSLLHRRGRRLRRPEASPFGGGAPARTLGRKGPYGIGAPSVGFADSSPTGGSQEAGAQCAPRTGGRPHGAAPTDPNGRGRWTETPHPSRPSAAPPSPKGEGWRDAPLKAFPFKGRCRAQRGG